MDPSADRTHAVVVATLEQELRLIGEAVALVASGAAIRTTVAGLQLGDALVEPARRMGAEAGVRIVPLWRTDEAGLDIAVERLEDDAS